MALLLSLVTLLLTQTVTSADTWSCTADLNGGTRNCCPSTGLCQDSSCTVFGFKNSARANCHVSGSNPNCPNSICNFTKPNCPQTSDGRHCYGRIICSGGGSSCFGYGQLCLEDGGSDNFKVCQSACKNDNDCPTGAHCNKKINPAECIDSFSAAVEASSCCPLGTTQCQLLETPGLLANDIPNTRPQDILGALTQYGCTQPNPNCNTIKCTQWVPDDVRDSLMAVEC